MIGIKLEGADQFLDTSPGTTIDVTIENPILGESDKLSPGSYSLPFTLPAGDSSPKNATILKNADVIENSNLFEVKRADLFFDQVHFKSGNLKVKSATDRNLSSYFTFGLSTIHESLKTAKLRDVVSEPAVVSSTSITKRLYIKKLVDPDNDWDITLNGVNYTGTAATVLAAINADGELTVDTGKHVPFVVNDSGVNSPKGFLSPDYLIISLVTYVLSYDPIFDVWFPLPVASSDPLQELSLSTGDPDIYLIEAFDMDTYYDEFDTFLATFPSDKLVFPVCFNATPYGDEMLIKTSEVVNGVNASGIIRNSGDGLNTKVRNRNSLQPFVRLKHVLDKIATTFGFEWEGDFYEHGDISGIIIDNNFSLDSPQPWIEGETFVFWKRSFNINDLVPDMSVIDFLSGIKSRYNLGIYFNETTQKARMCFLEDIAKRTDVDDITPYCSPVQDIEDLRVTGYTITVPAEDSDKLSVVETLEVGTPQEDIVIKCGRIHESASAVVSGAIVHGIRVSRKYGEKFGLRVFHYNGIVNNGTYSYQSSVISSANMYEPLESSGSDVGVYEHFWKYWLIFKQNRRLINVRASFPFRLLRNLDWEKKCRFDRSDFLLKSVKIRLTNQRVEVSDVELITMR